MLSKARSCCTLATLGMPQIRDAPLAMHQDQSESLGLHVAQRINCYKLPHKLPQIRSAQQRQMAADYQLNTITVSRAYQELAHEGLVEKRRGLGMFMTEQAGTQLRNSERDRFLDEEWTAVLERTQRLGLGLDDLLPRGKSDEYDEGPSSDVIPVPPQR